MMVLVDTSIWIDHLRAENRRLLAELEVQNVLAHPLVIGELACGNLRNRTEILTVLHELPVAPVARDSEVLVFIERQAIWGRGLGFIDVHLLASLALSGDAVLWTRDRRLADVAAELLLAL